MNLVVLSGRIYHLKRFGPRQNIVSYTIRTVVPVKKKDENMNEITEYNNQYFNVTTFDNYGRYNSLKDGDEVIINGKLEEHTYENKEGKTIREVRIIANEVSTADVMIEKQNRAKNRSNGDNASWVNSSRTNTAPQTSEPTVDGFEISVDDELPF